MFALAVGLGVVACATSDDESGQSRGPVSTGGAASGAGPGGGESGSGAGGALAGGQANGGSLTGGITSGGALTGGTASFGGSGGAPTGGVSAGGSAGSGGTLGPPGGSGGRGGEAGGSPATGGSKATAGAGAGGAPSGGGGSGGKGSGGSGGGSPIQQPDCNAAMPSGGVEKSGNGRGGEGNLAWEIWSNTGQGELTYYPVPAFIASWNNAGGYLGRLGFEWDRNAVPHDQRGEISAQFVSRKTGSAGGYSYVGMYGWTTNPCVEWYVVDDSYNNMPINPGMTTKTGEVEIDGGTYIMYTRPTTGTGGTRCSNVSNWIQYYSVRRTARACGVISLSQHFRAWQSLGMDMTGELLEAKILVEVGGGVGNVELPIANVVVQ